MSSDLAHRHNCIRLARRRFPRRTVTFWRCIVCDRDFAENPSAVHVIAEEPYMIAEGAVNADDIVSYGLVYAMYAMCVVLVVSMSMMSLAMTRYDAAERIARRARQVQEHIVVLETDWPQYVIHELP